MRDAAVARRSAVKRTLVIASFVSIVVGGCDSPSRVCEFGSFGIEFPELNCRCAPGSVPGPTVRVLAGRADPWAGRVVQVCLPDDEEGFNPFGCATARPDLALMTGPGGTIESDLGSCLPGWMCVELAARIGAAPACDYPDLTRVVSGELAIDDTPCSELEARGLCSAMCDCGEQSCFGLSEEQGLGVCTDPWSPCSSPGPDDACGTDLCVHPVAAPAARELVGRCIPATRCDAWISSTEGRWSCRD